ncbi:alpha-ketoglutarate-dependent dioxygenase AlkB [Vitreoscilla massiliensis]|uniref:Alpha-ketoglutarate-dependent dioxygenase AlkB n=1 Tax=Vitreoscilla massiliensis TaxID=1689272 RepID=A0ABY4DZ66_9NEIS|nr:alpha-ketoglutarate-dependent dioxygenase AlkB [Vitreoscilla massiliensis]UOO88430.1 alpha-ketoglutarate-dependent dioxygenase AlkB [Vitreoscilla massiliensis]
MSHLPQLDGTLYVPDFIAKPDALLQHLLQQVAWDTRMQARLTASYGKAYNYSQMTYPEQAMLPALAELLPSIEQTIGFLPNNCLLNHYADGSARMGYHADQTEVLDGDTGIVIVSLGSERNFVFRNSADPSIKISHTLAHGSLFYMNQQVQTQWQHAIPTCKTDAVRLSLTFRCLK